MDYMNLIIWDYHDGETAHTFDTNYIKSFYSKFGMIFIIESDGKMYNYDTKTYGFYFESR